MIRVLYLSALNDPCALFHYCDVIMGAIASQISSLTIVYWTVDSGAGGDQWIPRTISQ